MTILDKSNLDNLRHKFETQLNSMVSLRLFTQDNLNLIIPERKCDTCATTQKILTDISNISDKVNLEIIDLYKYNNQYTELKIDRIPAIVIGKSGRAIFYGMPSGYEFSTLVNSIINSSLDSQNLDKNLIKNLKAIQTPINIKVFVTPSCKYCPEIAELTLSLAMQFKTIKTEIIEIQEYPDLANNYDISSVPLTIINDKIQLSGPISSYTLVESIVKIDEETRIS